MTSMKILPIVITLLVSSSCFVKVEVKEEMTELPELVQNDTEYTQPDSATVQRGHSKS